MTVSALFLMGSVAIFLLGTFQGLLAQTLEVRVSADTPTVAMARLQYLFAGVAIFGLGALAYLPEHMRERHDDWLSKLAFWLMIVGFNLAFFPTTLRRSHAFLSDPVRLLSPAVGTEVSLGAILFTAGMAICVCEFALCARTARN